MTTTVPRRNEPGMQTIESASRALALEGFKGAFTSHRFRSDPIWAAFRNLGSMLWLDTGSIDEVAHTWTEEFTHLTTNNTLVNKEIQGGQFDALIGEAAARLRALDPKIDPARLVREIGFILNSRVALRLVEAFGAFVSVELHPDVAHNVDQTVELGRRYFHVCPERFIVKVPLTPAGYIAVRRLRAEGVPVNFTLGFSARQNYLAAIISKPEFVNVFMGRLNQFIADNNLGDGKHVGEKATLAAQLALWQISAEGQKQVSRLIGASTREPQQIIDLAGLDVFTLPPRVASALHERMEKDPVRLSCCAELQFQVQFAPGVRRGECGVDVLWEITDQFRQAVRALMADRAALASPSQMLCFLASHGYGNLFRRWSEAELQVIREDGKIPVFTHWRQGLGSGEIALDDLMSVSALQAFATDQQELDDRIRRIAD
jgi:transaldolase